MNSVNNKAPKASPPAGGRLGGAVLQAAALIIIAASAIVAAATSRHPLHETCSREWEMRFGKINLQAGNISSGDSNAINQKTSERHVYK